MAQHVSVSRAAQLLGVSRSVLQSQVRDGLLVLNQGLVAIDSLMALYPHTRLLVSRSLDQAQEVRERPLPSQEVLSQRVFAQSQELADVRLHLQRYHELVISLQTRVRECIRQHPTEGAWRELEQQVTQGLAKALATESVDLFEVMDDMLKVMTAQVTVRPSGHEFLVEGRANLLQSGLHSGLKLNYGCSDGSCGMCKVRVISGEVVRTQNFNYLLSEAEKAQGYTLMCCHTAASSELTLEMLEARGPQDIPEQLIMAHVRAVSELAPDTRLLHLQSPRSQRLRFLAGQSVSLGWKLPGQDDVHSTYPIGSCPCDDRNLLFFVGRNEADEFARLLFAGDIQPGATITASGPTGEFVLADGHRPLVFAACDYGFVPINSLIEHALSLETYPSLSLFWLSTRRDGHFLGNHCRAWSEALDQFEYELVTNPDVTRGAHQILKSMRADLYDIDCDFYLAGPHAFVDTLHDELRAAGVASSQIFMQVM